MLPLYKPHVWVATSANPPVLYVKIRTDDGIPPTPNPSYKGGAMQPYLAAIDLDVPNNRLTIRYKLTTGGTGMLLFDPAGYPLTAAAGYAPGRKVTVKVLDPNDRTIGLMTVKPDPSTNFSYTPNPAADPVYKPYCWMQYINQTVSKLHVNVLLPTQRDFVVNGGGFILPYNTNDVPASHRRIITFQLATNTVNGQHEVDKIYILDANSGYDPIYEDIELIIQDNPGGGGFTDKSKTTSTESEADASGDHGN